MDPQTTFINNVMTKFIVNITDQMHEKPMLICFSFFIAKIIAKITTVVAVKLLAKKL